jgi:hypothetical protein
LREREKHKRGVNSCRVVMSMSQSNRGRQQCTFEKICAYKNKTEREGDLVRFVVSCVFKSNLNVPHHNRRIHVLVFLGEKKKKEKKRKKKTAWWNPVVRATRTWTRTIRPANPNDRVRLPRSLVTVSVVVVVVVAAVGIVLVRDVRVAVVVGVPLHHRSDATNDDGINRQQ